jgi:hypothetical protein
VIRKRALRAAFAVAAICASACGCARLTASGPLPLPADALATVALASGFAVLSGTDAAKTVTLLRPDGSVLLDFGATKEAVDLAAPTPDGPLYLALAGAGAAGRAGTGAIERWTLDGTRTGVVSLPGPPASLQPSGTKLYALLAYAASRGGAPVRALAEIDARRLALARVVPLDPGVESVAVCPPGAPWAALLVSRNGAAAALPAFGKRPGAPIVLDASAAVCDSRGVAFLEEPSPGVRVVSFRAFADPSRARDRPVAAEALRLSAAGDERVVVTAARPGASTLQAFDWNGT